ncbi:hypothetical protein GE061_008477 [Apolygus lucorum]|uniref:Piwi domain-containing protein n=1 Tax=Apolygus lucorum TaxID=248454 RepID=A0A8S9WKE3_APOLU|nr:hypothetical protein GE061_008477 [Apolygus lucorum]
MYQLARSAGIPLHFPLCVPLGPHSDLLAAVFMKCLVAFRSNNNGLLPTRIFFYRDRVGEGNYHYTLEVEVAKIVAMWNSTYPEAGECPLTYIIVSKGINAKIFLKANTPHLTPM